VAINLKHFGKSKNYMVWKRVDALMY